MAPRQSDCSSILYISKEAEVTGKVINQYIETIHWFDLKRWDISKLGWGVGSKVLGGFKDFLIYDWLRQ